MEVLLIARIDLFEFLQPSGSLLGLEARRDVQRRAPRRRSYVSQSGAQITSALQFPPDRLPIAARGGYPINLENCRIGNRRRCEFLRWEMPRSICFCKEYLHFLVPIKP